MSIMAWRMVSRRDVPPRGLMSLASVSILRDFVSSMLAWYQAVVRVGLVQLVWA